MADIDNGSSWLNFAKNQVKVSPDAKLSEKFILPSNFFNFWLFKLQSNVLAHGNHYPLGWLSIWPCPSLLNSCLLKLTLEK